MGDDDLREVTGLLTVIQAAQQAGVSRHTICGWITQGQLPAVRIAGRRYVRAEDLAATQARGPRRRRGAGLAAGPAAGRDAAAGAAGGGGAEPAPAGGGQWADARSDLHAGDGQARPVAETVRALAQALGVAPGAVRRARTAGADAADGGRGGEPPRRAGRAGADLAAPGAGRDQGLGAVAGAGGGGGGAGPEWPAAGPLPPPRPALPGMSGCRDGGTAFMPTRADLLRGPRRGVSSAPHRGFATRSKRCRKKTGRHPGTFGAFWRASLRAVWRRSRASGPALVNAAAPFLADPDRHCGLRRLARRRPARWRLAPGRTRQRSCWCASNRQGGPG